ncbi:M56 family metallopeptidase [Radiobacillus sp. PE A8.2]|uniref:M56 family metallopeptidase n=1 Tax=Radiobacillus sp. PE A8.2 TaxID=3380349 RepID=UPI00389076EC
MSDFFILVLSLSISGSILALFLFLIKPLIKHKLSKTLQYYIWLIVLFRLLFPFAFENSMMDNLFSDENPKDNNNTVAVQPITDVETTSNSAFVPTVEQNVANGIYNFDTDHDRYFLDLFNQYAAYVWIIGVIIALSINLIGYIRFLRYLKPGYLDATKQEHYILTSLIKKRRRVRLVRNRYVSTPMLIGIVWPTIIIPDTDFTEQQTKNILLHELSHMKRLDIGVKWLTMVVTSLHWFNPFMYFIKKEINRACELACDEAVIKHLTPAEKQAYGDTLISVVAEHKYPVGVLQATMSEEKKTLKERLLSIMKHKQKSKLIFGVSIILVGIFITGGLFVGAGSGLGENSIPDLHILTEEGDNQIVESGTWNASLAKGELPVMLDSVISQRAGQQFILSTQRRKLEKQYDLTIEDIHVYKTKDDAHLSSIKTNDLVEVAVTQPSKINEDLYMQAPTEPGEYIYGLTLEVENFGIVTYGFIVRVDMLTYDLDEIAKHQTPYIGNASKVSALAGAIPVADNNFMQHFISMDTDAKPYRLTVYYEPVSDTGYKGEWPIAELDSELEAKSSTNAFVLFTMIDNLDEVTFAYRITPSSGELDKSAYDTLFTFARVDMEKTYGSLDIFRDDLDALQQFLTGN